MFLWEFRGLKWIRSYGLCCLEVFAWGGEGEGGGGRGEGGGSRFLVPPLRGPSHGKWLKVVLLITWKFPRTTCVWVGQEPMSLHPCLQFWASCNNSVVFSRNLYGKCSSFMVCLASLQWTAVDEWPVTARSMVAACLFPPKGSSWSELRCSRPLGPPDVPSRRGNLLSLLCWRRA